MRGKTQSRRPIVVLGGRGGGTIAALSIEAASESGEDIELVGFLNDEMDPGTEIWGATVLGPFEAWTELPQETQFIAPLHSSAGMRSRRERIENLSIPRQRWGTVIDPRAIISRDVSIGRGSLVGPGAVLGHAASIGAHTAVRHGAHVAHDVVVGMFSFVGVNVVVGGYCSVGECVHLAPSAVVRDRVTIGDDAVVGVGAVVVADVRPRGIVGGNPARSIRSEGDD